MATLGKIGMCALLAVVICAAGAFAAEENTPAPQPQLGQDKNAAPAKQVEVDNFANLADEAEKFNQAINQKVDICFDAVPLSECAAHLARKCNVNIVLHKSVRNEEVTVDLKNVQLVVGLYLVATSLDLDVEPQNMVLYIKPKAQKAQAVARRHDAPVGKIIFSPFERLSFEYYLYDDVFSPKLHNRIRSLLPNLVDLGATQAEIRLGKLNLRPAEKAEMSQEEIPAVLRQKVDLVFDNVPLSEIANYLRDKYKLNIVLGKGLEDRHITTELRGVHLQSALDALTQQGAFQVTFKDGAIMLLAKDLSEKAAKPQLQNDPDVF